MSAVDLLAESPNMTQAEVATKYGISERTVRDWIKNGVAGVRLDAVHFGGRVKIADAAVRRFIAGVTEAKRAAKGT